MHLGLVAPTTAFSILTLTVVAVCVLSAGVCVVACLSMGLLVSWSVGQSIGMASECEEREKGVKKKGKKRKSG